MSPVVETGYLARLPRGPRPRLGYVRDSTYVALDGARTQLPTPPRDTQYVGVTTFGSGLLVARYPGLDEVPETGNAIVTELDAAGVETARWAGYPFVVDADSAAAVWFVDGDDVQVGDLATGRVDPVAVPRCRSQCYPQALVGPDVLVTDSAGRPRLVDLDGERVTLPPGLQGLTGVSTVHEGTRLAYGQRRGAPRTERAAALDLDTGATRWTTDRWFVRDASPDGRYVSAISSATGGDPDAIAVLDARTGDVVAELALLEDGLGEAGATFEPDGSLLVQLSRYTGTEVTWTVVRLDVDGDVRRVTPVLTTGGNYTPPFALGAAVRS